MSFLTQPYPFFHRGKKLLTIAVLILVFAFLFEYLLEPFNVTRSEHLFSYWKIVLLHSTNAMLIYIVYSLITAPFIDEEDWKIYKEVVFFMIFFFLVGVGQFFLRELIYDNPHNTSLRYFIEEIRNTYLVGSILLFIISVINLNLLTRRNQQKAESIPLSQKQVDSEPEVVQIEAQLASDHFKLQPSELLCIRSDGNYLVFFLNNGEKPQKKIIRLTLKSAKEQLSSFSFIIKTHRAYLINIHHVSKVTGNAQGYQLTLKNLDFKVPVSRSHIDSFNHVFR